MWLQDDYKKMNQKQAMKKEAMMFVEQFILKTD